MKKIINFYKNLTFFQGVTCAAVFTSILGIAATVGPMKTFTPNTVISSSEVNANFNALKTAIETNNSQVYKGTWSASSNAPDLSTLGMFSAGEYYVVTSPGTYSSINYNINDWIIFNGTSWEKIPSSSIITSIFGRTGVIAPMEGDYNLDKLSDVDLTTLPVDNQVLKFDAASTKWKAGNFTYAESDPSVQNFAKNILPNCAVNEVLKSNGSTFSCTPIGVFSGVQNRAVVTDAGGNLAVSSTTSTQLDYVNGVTSNIQTQLDSKAPMGAVVDWTIGGVQTIAPSRINLTVANRVVVTNVAAIPTTSSVTNTELGYLGGVTSSIQPQLDAKVNSTTAMFTGSVSSPYYIAPNGGTATSTIYRGNTAGVGVFFPSTSSLALATNGVERLSIISSGNVGIGKSAPSSKLDIGSTGEPTNEVTVNASSSGRSGFTANADGMATIHMISNFSGTAYQGLPNQTTGIIAGNNYPLVYSVGGLERMRIMSTGKVGIGNTNPGYALDVAGDINASGSVRANTVALTSDKRLKSNITTIKSALQKVLSLRGVEFNWIKNGTKDLGVIAQEVEKIFPALVMTDKEGMRSVKYSNMAGVLIESTKELNAKVVTLEQENKILKSYLCEKDPYASFCK